MQHASYVKRAVILLEVSLGGASVLVFLGQPVVLGYVVALLADTASRRESGRLVVRVAVKLRLDCDPGVPICL